MWTVARLLVLPVVAPRVFLMTASTVIFLKVNLRMSMEMTMIPMRVVVIFQRIPFRTIPSQRL